MNILRSGLVVALFSVMNSFPCYVCAMGEPTSSAVFTEVSNCSELTSGVDRDLCTRHLSALKDLIREKNNQASLSTSTAAPPIPETIRIRKISATNTRLDQEVFRTIYPTLFIFDSEQPTGNGQSAIYELPLTERDNGLFRSANSFQLPANSAFVGNRVDILPEFVINGGGWFHYVMSASCNDSVYYLANIKVNSRSPSDMGRSSTAVATVPPGSTPTERLHVPAGVLDLRGRVSLLRTTSRWYLIQRIIRELSGRYIWDVPIMKMGEEQRSFSSIDLRTLNLISCKACRDQHMIETPH